jgi:hypothetical protein
MSQKGGKGAYRSRLRKNQSACKSRHSVFSFRRDHVRLRSSPRRYATLSRHKAVRISSRCMRWVPRDVAAPGRSGQPLEQPASASWSVTTPSQPPADDCDWRLDLPRLQRRVPRAYANRTRVPRRDRGSDRERSSPQARAGAVGQRGRATASHRYRIASRRSRACLRGLWLSPPNLLQQSPVRRPRIDPAPRRARTCRDHLAGELGVAITDALVAVELSDEGATVAAVGPPLFSAAAFPPNGGPWNHRLYCRPRLDWSERRPHLADVLAKALLERALQTKLVRRREGSRALDVAQGPDDMLERLDLV